MPEAVDRLELVADGEHLSFSRSARDEVDELALQRVRVLELVDHHRTEAELLDLEDLGPVAEQVARGELEILEIDDRLAPLRLRIRRRIALEQLLEQIAVARGELLQRSALDPLARVLVLGRPIRVRTKRHEIEEAFSDRPGLREQQRVAGRLALLLGGIGISGEPRGGLVPVGDRVGEALALSELEHEIAACRAQCRVDARQHLAQPACAVGRKQTQSFRVATSAERLQRAVERLAAKHR